MALNSDPCQFTRIVKRFSPTVILGLDPRIRCGGALRAGHGSPAAVRQTIDGGYCGVSEPRMSAQKRLALPVKDEFLGVWLSPSEAASS